MSTPVGDTQPSSFDDASLKWSDEPAESGPPPDDTPAADAPAASSPEAAIEPSVETPREGDGTGQHQGPIPFDRHKTILDGRTRERDEFKGKYESLTWAEQLASQGYTPDQISQSVQFANFVATNPSAFLEHYQRTLQSDPASADQLRSWAARVLGGSGQKAPTQDSNPEPQPDLRSEDGKLVYSDTQLRAWNDWNTAKLMSEVRGMIAPLQARNEKFEQAEKDHQVYQGAFNATAAEIQEMRVYPYFEDHKADIAEFMKSKGFKGVSVKDAYRHVLNTKVFPTLRQTAKAEAVADMRKSAAASSAPPSAGGASTPKAPKSFFDLPKSAWE